MERRRKRPREAGPWATLLVLGGSLVLALAMGGACLAGLVWLDGGDGRSGRPVGEWREGRATLPGGLAVVTVGHRRASRRDASRTRRIRVEREGEPAFESALPFDPGGRNWQNVYWFEATDEGGPWLAHVDKYGLSVLDLGRRTSHVVCRVGLARRGFPIEENRIGCTGVGDARGEPLPRAVTDGRGRYLGRFESQGRRFLEANAHREQPPPRDTPLGTDHEHRAAPPPHP